MPAPDQIIIHPATLQKILNQLSAKAWTDAEIIIRDTGTQFIIRDPFENFITVVDKTTDDG